MFAVISEFAVCRSRFAICNANETDRRAVLRRGCEPSRPDDNPRQRAGFKEFALPKTERAVFDVDRAARVPDGSYAQSQPDSLDSRSCDASAFSALQRYVRTLSAFSLQRWIRYGVKVARSDGICVTSSAISSPVARFFTPAFFRIFR